MVVSISNTTVFLSMFQPVSLPAPVVTSRPSAFHSKNEIGSSRYGVKATTCLPVVSYTSMRFRVLKLLRATRRPSGESAAPPSNAPLSKVFCANGIGLPMVLPVFRSYRVQRLPLLMKPASVSLNAFGQAASLAGGGSTAPTLGVYSHFAGSSAF